MVLFRRLDRQWKSVHDVKNRPGDELFEIFRSFDRNGDGLIDEQEFGRLLESLGWDSEPEVRSLEFAAVDSNYDGLLDFREFADWWNDQN